MQTEREFDRSALEAVLGESSDPDNPGPDEIHDLVRRTISIAVVGMSRDLAKAARRVPSYLAAKGADVIPVNPNATRILGKPARHSLQEVEEAVDMVLVFRPPAEAGAVVDTAAARPDRPIIWLQEGIRADEAVTRARAEGLSVVQDLCLYKVHRALGDTLRRAIGRWQDRTF
ncbi:MAG: CoA-binding protein [Gemmatimonadales bacterium]|jgi:predicted CoA-binding protein|nr:MAG: CoA-binding protein [Gemmatimonadales bacterium]